MNRLNMTGLLVATLMTCSCGVASAQSNQVFGSALRVELTTGNDICSIESYNFWGTSYIKVDNGESTAWFPAQSISSIYVFALEGHDTVLISQGSIPVDAYLTVFGDDGNDFIDCGTAGGAYVSGGAGEDTVFGTNQADSLFGNDGLDQLYGDGGNDGLNGGNGNDYLSAGDGNDTLIGGPGNDTLRGGNGADYLSGDAGNDALRPGGGENETAVFGGQGTDHFYILVKSQFQSQIVTELPMDNNVKEKKSYVWK